MQQTEEERSRAGGGSSVVFDFHSYVSQNQLLGNGLVSHTPHPPEEPLCIPDLS